MPRTEIQPAARSKDAYRRALRALQIELVKIQKQVIAHNHRVLILFEGRDAAGKDGVIKRIAKHLSPRDTRIVALGKPSDREWGSWYFQRFVPHLPADGEITLFNRSWYNRAGVERVMAFASEDQVAAFYDMVGGFEHMLARDGIQIFKYYLDISRKEQARRLKARSSDPLKQWKRSPIDAVAQEKWDAYSAARNDMLRRTDFEWAPWYVVRSDTKREARLNTIRHIVTSIDCPDKDAGIAAPDKRVVFHLPSRRLAWLNQ